jgi:hypothetical protein
MLEPFRDQPDAWADSLRCVLAFKKRENFDVR